MKPFGQYLLRPVDFATLALFRILFGAAVLWQTIFMVYPHIDDWYSPGVFHFTYYGFDWVRPWPAPGMILHVIVMAAAATGIMVGLTYRLSAIVFFLTYTHVFLIEQAEYNNHYYLMGLLALLFCVTDAGSRYSVDSAIGLRKPNAYVPFWHYVIFRAQIVIVYFFGGVAKVNGDWLRGQPLLYWLPRESHLPVIGPILAIPWTAYFLSYTGLFLDLLVGFMLLHRRARPIAVLLLLVFHGLNSIIFSIHIFPWLAFAATIVFFDPDAPTRLVSRLAGQPCPVVDSVGSESSRLYRWAVFTFIGVYLAVQIALPLRHFFYPGNTMWTEEGHTFAWHMKLSHKRATASYEVIDPGTGLSTIIGTKEQLEDLSQRQRMQVLARPDMILEYAHFLRDKFSAKGISNPIVHAYVNVSLNGRPMQPLIDPKADLAQAKQSWFAHADWILQLPENLPIGIY